jgi:hypothetical protein
MTDLSKMLKKDLIIMIEKVEAENQNLVHQNKTTTTELTEFANINDTLETKNKDQAAEIVELKSELTAHLKNADKSIQHTKGLEAENKNQAAEIRVFKTEALKMKVEIKTLADRLNAKRKAIETSGKALGKYPIRKNRNTKPRKNDPIEDTSCSSAESESESGSNSDTSFDQELPKSKDLARRARKIINSDSSSAESDEIIKVPKAILLTARKSVGSKKTATLHAFSTTKAAKTANVPGSSKLTHNPRPSNAKIPRPAAPVKLLSFYTSFLKRKSKNELIEMIEMQCFKL